MGQSFKPMGVALVELCSHSGAMDGFVQQGGELLESTLSLSDEKAEKIAKKIGSLTAEYRQSGRLAPEIYMKFEGGSLLVVWNDIGGVSLRFSKPPARIESIVAECRTFLRQVLDDAPPLSGVLPAMGDEGQSEGGTEVWPRFEPELIQILAPVVSRSQTKKIIQRVLESLEVAEPVPDVRIEEITRKVLEKIPDRRKREALAAQANEELKQAFNF